MREIEVIIKLYKRFTKKVELIYYVAGHGDVQILTGLSIFLVSLAPFTKLIKYLV